MKKGLLATTALVGVGALTGGAAFAAEAPTYKLSGNMNFQAYFIDADITIETSTTFEITNITGGGILEGITNTNTLTQDHGWYFGVDEAELQLKVSGAADNGLKYGFKIELNANTTDGTTADEAVISLSGGWGTLLLGDEDGAEDIMNYGGENVMVGDAGGFDGDADDILLRAPGAVAPSGPAIEGDTSDHTKVTYYSPRFSGFQVGASLTPTPSMDGDEFKDDDADLENHYGLGANYDNSFGDLRVRVSAVYSAASSNVATVEDIAAWSVGGIVGFSGFSVGANYTDNGDSGFAVGSGDETSYWDVAVGFETGPMAFAVGYFASVFEPGVGTDLEFTNIALTANYTVAPGLGVYADLQLIEDESSAGPVFDQDATVLILGINASF